MIYNTSIDNCQYNNFVPDFQVQINTYFYLYTYIQRLLLSYYNILNNDNLHQYIIIFISTLAILFLTLYEKYQYRYEKLLSEYKYLVKNTINRKREIQNLKNSLKTKECDLSLYDKEFEAKNIEIYILQKEVKNLKIEIEQNINLTEYNKLKSLIKDTVFTIKNSRHTNEFEQVINKLEDSIGQQVHHMKLRNRI